MTVVNIILRSFSKSSAALVPSQIIAQGKTIPIDVTEGPMVVEDLRQKNPCNFFRRGVS
jgi:hypothetical protein